MTGEDVQRLTEEACISCAVEHSIYGCKFFFPCLLGEADYWNDDPEWGSLRCSKYIFVPGSNEYYSFWTELAYKLKDR